MKWQFLLSIKIKGPENTLKEIKIENIYLKTEAYNTLVEACKGTIYPKSLFVHRS